MFFTLSHNKYNVYKKRSYDKLKKSALVQLHRKFPKL